MKSSPSGLHRQRALLDVRFKKARPALDHLAFPRGGWIKAVRESLGMTQAQLARRMGVSQSVVAHLERSEQRKAISLASLERAAQAMGCAVTWAIHPPRTLDELVEQRALALATARMQRTTHSMSLEAQTPDAEQTAAQVKEQARELKQRLSLWSEA
jgi:predicted DNA-binding mobile mystery protein A